MPIIYVTCTPTIFPYISTNSCLNLLCPKLPHDSHRITSFQQTEFGASHTITLLCSCKILELLTHYSRIPAIQIYTIPNPYNIHTNSYLESTRLANCFNPFILRCNEKLLYCLASLTVVNWGQSLKGWWQRLASCCLQALLHWVERRQCRGPNKMPTLNNHKI